MLPFKLIFPPPSWGARNEAVLQRANDAGPRGQTEAQRQDTITKSTRTVDQRHRVVQLLRVMDPITFDLRELAGAMQASTRIFELRQRGYVITTERVVVTDKDGYTHAGVARYHLVSEPAKSGTQGAAQ